MISSGGDGVSTSTVLPLHVRSPVGEHVSIPPQSPILEKLKISLDNADKESILEGKNERNANMDLREAKLMAEGLMKQHGLTGWNFKFDRAVKRFGACNSYRKLITLSAPLTAVNTEYRVNDTILHEIAHALVGCVEGHNAKWRAKAVEIGAAPKACVSGDGLNLPQGKWTGTCPSCGKVRRQFSKPRVQRSCGTCSPVFDQRFVFNWIKA